MNELSIHLIHTYRTISYKKYTSLEDHEMIKPFSISSNDRITLFRQETRGFFIKRTILF